MTTPPVAIHVEISTKIPEVSTERIRAVVTQLVRIMTGALPLERKARLAGLRIRILHCDPHPTNDPNRWPPEFDHATFTREFSHLDYTADGRHYNTVAGFAGTLEVPMMACSKDLICDETDWPVDESIFVHEFAHTIMNMAMGGPAFHGRIHNAYAAYAALFTTKACRATYACANVDEMWSEASQAWFGATARADVNRKIATVSEIAKLPGLYAILEDTYGPPTSVCHLLEGCRGMCSL